MAVGWFVCGYTRQDIGSIPARVCAMVAFSAPLRAVGGVWREIEVLGGRALVKVRAPSAALDTLAAQPGIRRIPLAFLDESLSSLTQNQRNAIRQELLDAGYTDAQITSALPDLAATTLREVLRFFASRRQKPRHDAVADDIVLDGPDQPCEDVDAVDASLPDV